MEITTNQSEWARSEQRWEAHKDIIASLYLGQKKPLKEVIQIMDEQRGFKAT